MLFRLCLSLQNTALLRIRLITLCLFFTASSASAASLITDTELYFGELAIPRNNSISTVSLTRTGRSNSTGSVFILTIGTPGEYTLANLPPYTRVGLSVTLPVNSNTSFPTPPLRITALDMPSAINTDATGSADIIIGGTLSTSGTGEAYVSSATYPFYIPLELTF